jgi:hypothetical protein
VPSGPILNVKEMFENEQVQHLQMAVPVKHPALGEIRVQAPPSPCRGRPRRCGCTRRIRASTPTRSWVRSGTPGGDPILEGGQGSLGSLTCPPRSDRIGAEPRFVAGRPG